MISIKRYCNELRFVMDMKVEEIGLAEYDKITNNCIVYNTAAFNELNKYKVEQVHYLLFYSSEGKKRFAFCIGEDKGRLIAPFSAPFASFVNLHSKWDIEQLNQAVVSFDEWCIQHSFKFVDFRLPPDFYDRKMINALQNAFLINGYQVKYADLNYAIDLFEAKERYVGLLTKNGKKNLRIALNSNLELKYCDNLEDKEIAYKTVAINRQQKGYPLRMSWEQVRQTIEIIPNDFWLVYEGTVVIASAVVFEVTSDIMQVIYWGDISGYSCVKPINYLAYMLVKYYCEKKKKYLDIGPSSEEGIANWGLCDFKDSIGCFVSSKFSFRKEYGK